MISRAATSRANMLAARRVAAQARQSGRTWQRFQSSSVSQSTSSASTHLAAGVAGGGVVVLAGYAWYHTSGLKTAVQTSKDVKDYLQSTRDTVVQKARAATENPSAALDYLRGVARSYSSFVPGASGYVDTTFDQLEELRQTHGEEMDNIVKEVTDEMTKVAKEGGADASTAAKVYEILRKGIARLQELGGKVGGDILEKNPALKEKLGGGYEQLKSLAEKGGPDAKKVLDEVKKQLKELATKGSLDQDSLKKAQQLVQEKTSQLQELAKSSGGDFIQGGSESLKKVLGSLPMGNEILEKAPHLQDIMNLADKRGKEAKELLEETYQDIVKILEEKGKKAKDLGEKAEEDVKKEGKKAKK